MVFGSFIKNKHKKALYFGSPEAEAESLPSSRVMLSAVYEDHHDLFNELSHEKFIVVGRKGAGKSAFAEYTYWLAKNDPNIFCSFIRQDVVRLEELVQINEGLNGSTKEHLFKWLIYTNILKLIFKNEAANVAKELSLLKEFLKKNSGFIDINKGEITDLAKKYNFEVNVEQFKRFFTTKIGKEIQFKESRAPYYKLLPHLETVIISVLNSKIEVDNSNSYVIFFDDLDINFNSDDEKSVDTLLNLLRTTKHINNNVFSKNNINAKAVILIRDDVERMLSSRGADIAKVFSSYATRLDWYQEDQGVEDDIGLKKLVERRSKYAFEKAGLNINGVSAWDSLIMPNEFNPKTSFKYISDHTFLRPRDFILLFKPLETGQYEIPLNKYNTNSLIGIFSAELVKELSNELSSFYSERQITNIFESLKEINSIYNCSYNAASRIISRNCPDIDQRALLVDLFDRSIIGNINPSNNFVKFKHRISSRDINNYKLNEDEYIIVHTGIKIFIEKRY
ncbi:MAG: hypothetical protein OC189_09640 [Acinetobacter sp.]|uniref:P-loop ATPase, Sll1717 family n=1 Tax=Acinetobacter sp. TaxID=472 RepID=UPI002582964C|nr:hypothetical protein [Acinetobacter sp.]MDK4792288.1 hypothetical protein [Acinetobacter sp.]